MNEVDRLLDAIEQLLDAEGAALRGGQVADAVEMQSRVAPVIGRLIEILSNARGLPMAPARVAERVHGVRLKRRENLDLLIALKAERETLRTRLAEARVHRKRVTPAYGQKKIAVPRFSAAV